MLSDASSFSCCYARRAQCVKERGLAVVDVPHNGNDGRAEGQCCLIFRRWTVTRENRGQLYLAQTVRHLFQSWNAPRVYIEELRLIDDSSIKAELDSYQRRVLLV